MSRFNRCGLGPRLIDGTCRICGERSGVCSCCHVAEIAYPVSHRALSALSDRGGKMTRRQWIGETCLLKPEIRRATEKRVRKTKRHVILVDHNERECGT